MCQVLTRLGNHKTAHQTGALSSPFNLYLYLHSESLLHHRAKQQKTSGLATDTPCVGKIWGAFCDLKWSVLLILEGFQQNTYCKMFVHDWLILQHLPNTRKHSAKNIFVRSLLTHWGWVTHIYINKLTHIPTLVQKMWQCMWWWVSMAAQPLSSP